jgi:hypothetical protein
MMDFKAKYARAKWDLKNRVDKTQAILGLYYGVVVSRWQQWRGLNYILTGHMVFRPFYRVRNSLASIEVDALSQIWTPGWGHFGDGPSRKYPLVVMDKVPTKTTPEVAPALTHSVLENVGTRTSGIHPKMSAVTEIQEPNSIPTTGPDQTPLTKEPAPPMVDTATEIPADILAEIENQINQDLLACGRESLAFYGNARKIVMPGAMPVPTKKDE